MSSSAFFPRCRGSERIPTDETAYLVVGRDSRKTEQYKFCKTQCDSLAHIPPSVNVKAIPTFRNPAGRDPRDFISEQIWKGLAGDAGVVDIIGLPDNLQ